VIRLNPPAEIKAYARLILVTALITNEEFEQALEKLEEMDKLPDPSPAVSYLKGVVLSSLARPAEARTELERYAAAVGWDRDVHETMADCHLEEGSKEKALEHALKGLADHKESPGCLATAAVASPAVGIAGLKKHFDATLDPESSYEIAIDYAIDREDMEVAKAVFALLKESKPDSELIEYYEEEFTEQRGEMEEAEDSAMDDEEEEDAGE
jgi:tetratricopeptide (TPR) repeat protein